MIERTLRKKWFWFSLIAAALVAVLLTIPIKPVSSAAESLPGLSTRF
ncbi:MAG: hypothetical protein HYX91_03955 [Chloroflexi bacterium]|nr:hypothetical protein [Chloroflexota bacterium]